MTLVLAYAARELDAAEECKALGIDAIVPRRVDLIRQGKRRRPDVVITAAWPRYLFADITPDQWHWLSDTKHVRSLMWVGDREAQLVRKQAAAIERAFADRMAQIEAGERVWHYEPGDLLQIIGGTFAGQVATFTRMAEGQDFPRIKAEVQVFGRMVPAELDPLAVRKATA